MVEMKKKYIAPRVSVEYFELAEHIASCGTTTKGDGNAFGNPTHHDGSSCEFVTNGGAATMFLDGNNKCTIITDPNNMIVGCYNTPDGTLSMFAS